MEQTNLRAFNKVTYDHMMLHFLYIFDLYRQDFPLPSIARLGALYTNGIAHMNFHNTVLSTIPVVLNHSCLSHLRELTVGNC